VRITSRIELFGPAGGAVESRVFHATEDGAWTLCNTPKSTAGMTDPPPGYNWWPPELADFGSACPECTANVAKLDRPA
jgi:hypothetical protein